MTPHPATVEVGAAPHPPAGTFSPYSDGEKEAGRDVGGRLATLAIGETVDDSVPLPVTIRGEDAGRQVRGSADAEGLLLAEKQAKAEISGSALSLRRIC
ncbi:hypothetical protein EJ071_02460 [Mesorhizobium sp. M1B.F.Ca.ET.045.04.1.1]|nr:hypothetical protein EJ071_02460 [Mesorhizobium sp. M1B.F.Ca.ET.045.04.1.1]